MVEAAGEKAEAAEEAPAAEERPAKRRAVAKAKKPVEPLQPVEHPSHQKVHPEHANTQSLLGLNAGFRMIWDLPSLCCKIVKTFTARKIRQLPMLLKLCP